jgi:TrmH family RNA methyltransferase
MLITSSNNDRIKELKKLKDRKYRDEQGLFLVEGEHLITEAYKSGCLIEILLLENISIDIDVKQTIITMSIMKELSSLTTPPTMIGICKKIISQYFLGNKIMMLDSIQDPGNLGTIIRSAVAFNIDTIVLGEGCVDIYNPKVLRATQGLIFHQNIIEDNLYNLINKLKNDNYHILGTRVDGGTSLKQFKKLDKFAIIMGNEGHGTSEYIEALCDDFIYIEMNDACESLNVAVAASIILYELS